MGNEVKCVAKIDGKRHEGKALLETSELIFRGAELRAKIAFGEIREVTAAAGELLVKTQDGVFAFELGDAAAKWREKILHPKTRIEKLGVKPGMRVSVQGKPEPDFSAELKKSKAEVVNGSADGTPELIFLFVRGKKGLGDVGNIAKQLKGAAGLWIAYPKGKKELTETDVIGAGRKAGLKDIKVVGFSPTHTALKFVIPVERR